jgi:hypothetical protein
MFCEVGADGSDGILWNGFATLLEFLHQPGEQAEIVKDQAVGHEVVVRDGFALLVTTILGDDAFTATNKSEALNRFLKWTFFGPLGALNGGAELRIGDVGSSLHHSATSWRGQPFGLKTERQVIRWMRKQFNEQWDRILELVERRQANPQSPLGLMQEVVESFRR